MTPRPARQLSTRSLTSCAANTAAVAPGCVATPRSPGPFQRLSRVTDARNRVTNGSDAQQKAAQAAVFVGDNIKESFSSPSISSPFDISS